MALLLITRFTLQEAIRRRLFLAVIILSALLLVAFIILLTVAINLVQSNSSATGGGGPSAQLLLLSGGVFFDILIIWLVYLLSSLLTIVLTTNMISGEVEAGTFAVIVPKPISRAEIVIGKWLGSALIVVVYTALMFFVFLAVIYWKTGYWPSQSFSALGTLELAMLALLGLTTMGSAFVPTIVNGAIVLVLFIGAPVASFVQFVVQVISPAHSQALQNVATAINLIIPTDALWHGTSFFLLPSAEVFPILGLSSNSFNTPFTSTQPIATALLIWVACYILVLPLIAVLRFQRRDL
ncbi:MAG TPA: ABC transporter permease subunit [Ktedonobacteraceae bacterium]|nr:ABC transporter permease subunit [Ktedonobacteraceae bacterium]